MFIYKITNKLNGMSYIGQTTKSTRRRFLEHKWAMKYKNRISYITNALRDYGINAFNFEEIDFAKTREALDELESFYIKKYNTLAPNGYNLTTGGSTNKVVSEETIQKLKKASMGNTHAISCFVKATCILTKCTFYFRSYSFLKKMYKLRPQTLSEYVNTGKPLFGYIWESSSKEDFLNSDKIYSFFELKNMGRARPVYKINIKTNESVLYNSITEATFEGFQDSKICSVCKGKRKTHGGFKWKYANIIGENYATSFPK